MVALVFAVSDGDNTFSGPDSGVGAKDGLGQQNPEVGRGRQQIVVSEAPRHIGVHLEFEGLAVPASYTLVRTARERAWSGGMTAISATTSWAATSG